MPTTRQEPRQEPPKHKEKENGGFGLFHETPGGCREQEREENLETGAESDQEYIALTSITVLVRTVCRRARGPCFPSSLRDARSASTFHLGGLAERDADEPLRLTKPQ